MHATLVAAIGDVEMQAEGDAKRERARGDVVHQAHSLASGAGSTACGFRGNGCSDTSKIPCSEPSLTKVAASSRAAAKGTSNSAQTLSRTICSRVLSPSAEFHMQLATGFNVKRPESSGLI